MPYRRLHPEPITFEGSIKYDRAVRRRRKQERGGTPDWWEEQEKLEEGKRLTVPLSAIVALVLVAATTEWLMHRGWAHK